MLRITPKEQGSKLTLSLEGKLAGAWVAELAQAWAEARDRTPAADTTIDLRLVWFIDEPGRELLTALHGEGCLLLGSGTFVGPIIQGILEGGERGAAPLRLCWMTALGLAAAAALAAAEPPAPGLPQPPAPAVAPALPSAPAATSALPFAPAATPALPSAPAPAPAVAPALPPSPAVAPVLPPLAPAAGSTLSLSLVQAVETALAQNPAIQKSLLAIAQSQEDRRMAAGSLMPSLDAQAGMTRIKQNLDALLGSPEPGYLSVGPFNTGAIGVGFNVPIFDLSLWQKWKASRHGEDSAKAQAHATREAITALVVGQYLRAQRAQEAVKAAQSHVALALALEKLASDQLKNGLGTRMDQLRSQVELQTERQRLIQAQTQLTTATFGLIKLLDLAPTTRVELSDALSAPELPGFTFQEAYSAGLKQRPERAALDARELAAESLRSSARSLNLPSLVASGNYTTLGLSPNQPWVPTYQLSVAVKVPLFTGGRISAQTAKAKAELETVKQERKELDAQVGLEVQVAQAEMASARSEVDVAALAVTLALEEVLQSRHRFEAGVSNNIEVINAQDELARATDNRINALYRLNQSRADLARAMGQLEPLFKR